MPRNRVKGGEVNSKSGTDWTKEELVKVFHLYRTLGGKKIHENNPLIIALGEQIGRTTRSVETQLNIFKGIERGGNYGRNRPNSSATLIWQEHQHNTMRRQHVDSGEKYPFQFSRWKSASSGGVRKPFDSTSGRPSKDLIATNISIRIRKLIEEGELPKVVFLVGGPGNGKTDALEQFVSHLDERFNLDGNLTQLVEEKYRYYARKITVTSSELKMPVPFDCLQLVQDASERAEGTKNAAATLYSDLLEVLSEEFRGIYLCCVNRGIIENLKRILTHNRSEIVEQFVNALQLAISPTILSTVSELEEISIWPVGEKLLGSARNADRIYIWPMDIDSLLVKNVHGTVPFKELINSVLLDPDRWKFPTAEFNPIVENYELLKSDSHLEGILKYLRSYELLAGMRFSFRDLLSFVSYIFYTESYDEINSANGIINNSRSSFIDRFKAIHQLVNQLYYYKIFPWHISKKDLVELKGVFESLKSEHFWRSDRFSALEVLAVIFAPRPYVEPSYLDGILSSEIIKELDPSKCYEECFSEEDNSRFSYVDSLFSNGISVGLEKISGHLLPMEVEYLKMLSEVEDISLDINDVSGRAMSYLPFCTGVLRKYAAVITKRSIGIRNGIVNNGGLIDRFTCAFHDDGALAELIKDVQSALFPDDKLEISFCTGVGQPRESLLGDAVIQVGSSGEIDGERLSAFPNLPSWDIIYLTLEKGSKTQSLYLNLASYLNMLKLSRLKILPGCISPDLFIWKDRLISNISSSDVRDKRKLRGKEIILSNSVKIPLSNL